MLNQQSTIFISGASDGIGKAMAFEIARRTACKLALCGRSEEKLKNIIKFYVTENTVNEKLYLNGLRIKQINEDF